MTLSRRNVLRGAVALGAAGAVAPLTARSAQAVTHPARRGLRLRGRRRRALRPRGRPQAARGRPQRRRRRGAQPPRRPRVRRSTPSEADLHFDGGAEFIGPTQNHIQALADEFGVATLPDVQRGPQPLLAQRHEDLLPRRHRHPDQPVDRRDRDGHRQAERDLPDDHAGQAVGAPARELLGLDHLQGLDRPHGRLRGRQAAALADLLLDAVGRARAGLRALHVQLHRLGR